jgi:hypothetical protein
MTRLRISPDLALPIEAVTEAIGFLGRRGSGKSYAAQKLAEEFHRARAQFVVLDPVGNWWALRLGADGVSPGLPIYVFGGLQGDVPLEPTAGKMIADVIVDRGISAVIDVSQFESDADKARFARAFCERFYFRKKSAPSAVHVFLEEAQEFIPQNPGRDDALMLHAFTRLAKLGRNFGIGISMLSQRPQEVNKKVLNLAELLFVFQLTGTHERKAVEAWIGDKGIEAEDIQAELPKLERGHPHAWSPAWLKVSRVIEIGAKTTFDASSTPKVGAQIVVRELSPIDLEQLRVDMAASVEKAKADDPKELRKEIATLRAQLTKAQKSPAAVIAKQITVIDRDEVTRLAMKAFGAMASAKAKQDASAVRAGKAAIDQLEQTTSVFAAAIAGRVVPGLRRMLSALEEAKPADFAPANGNSGNGHGAHLEQNPSRRTESVVRTVTPRASSREVSDTTIGGTPQRMVNALRFLETVGTSSATRQAIAGLVGISWDTGTFRTYLSQLRAASYIEDYADGRVALTDAGRAISSDEGLPSTRAELHRAWLSKLGGTPANMLRILLERYPDDVDRAELGAACGIDATTGTFRTYLSQLRSPGLITDESRTTVRAADALFPEGLR